MMKARLVVGFCCLLTLVKGSFKEFHTREGCNATLTCYHQLNQDVMWYATGFPIQGPTSAVVKRQQYSTLAIHNITTSAQGNVTCTTSQGILIITYALSVQQAVVCEDKQPTAACQTSIDDGDPCTSSWMVTNCQKSCKRCPPEINCTASETPTEPPTSSIMQSSSNIPTTSKTPPSSTCLSTAVSPAAGADSNNAVNVAISSLVLPSLFLLSAGVRH